MECHSRQIFCDDSAMFGDIYQAPVQHQAAETPWDYPHEYTILELNYRSITRSPKAHQSIYTIQNPIGLRLSSASSQLLFPRHSRHNCPDKQFHYDGSTSTATSTAITKNHATKPDYSSSSRLSPTRSIAAYCIADSRDQRHCEHPTLASRVTLRAASSYPAPFHFLEVLKPGTQSKVLLQPRARCW